MKTPIKLFLFTLTFIFILSESISACLCNESKVPPCVEFGRANTVFLGTVTKIEHPKKSNDAEEHSTISFDVEQIYKGNAKSKIDAKYWFGTSCSWLKFEVGERWLVYGYGDGNSVNIRFCSRTSPYNPQSEDSKFLNNYILGKTNQFIFGKILAGSYDGIENVPITAKGNGKTYRTKTDKEGIYQIDVADSGNYEMTSTVPFSAYPAPNIFYFPNNSIFNVSVEENESSMSWKTNVEKGLCTYKQVGFIKIDLKANASISGKVLDSDGKRMPNVLVELIKATVSEEYSLKNTERVHTDEKGRFIFSGLREGKYKIVINRDNFPTENMPFLKTYLPNTPNFSDAEIIVLEQDKEITGLELKMPNEVPKVEINGQIFWKNGKFIPGIFPNEQNVSPPTISIYSIDGKYIGEPYDLKFYENGKFSMYLFEGFSYYIKVEAMNENGERFHNFIKVEVDKNLKPFVVKLNRNGYGNMREFLEEVKNK